jgi:polyhydroxybutyrate depolymerase
MKIVRLLHYSALFLVLASFSSRALAQAAAPTAPPNPRVAGLLGRLPQNFARVTFPIEGVEREALVYAPPSAKTTATPVVFVFHGHGGTAAGGIRGFAIQQQWPEAISVYMQGLNTPGRLTDPEGKKPGWQHRVGDQGDRDLKFFDAVLARLKQDYRVDPKRLYATGHSNGGGFTYLLWAERGDLFAAVAPSGSAAAESIPKLKPKPALHVAGEKDPLVRFEWQRLTMNVLRKRNGCATEGKPWGEYCTLFESTGGTPLVEFIHPGGHEFPKGAPVAMVKFFKEHPME